ncbi:MAG: lytic transglycosylase domain-containing protein [Acidobacteriota bacterium]
MPKAKPSRLERGAAGVAVIRRKLNRRFRSRLTQPKRIAVLMLGMSLSVGGASEAMQNVHFFVERDLDSMKIVQKRGLDETVVATMPESFASNSLFKLSRVFPDRFVSPRTKLFDTAWLHSEKMATGKIHRELTLINDSIREQFFSTAMPFGDLIHEKARKYDVNPALVAAVIEQESKFHSSARSQKGARGLMQLMPKTGRWMGARDLNDPEENIDAGVKYLKYLSERFDGDMTKTLAAYNAGEGTVLRYGGVPPYRETRTYVAKVMKNYEKRNRQLSDFRENARADSPSESQRETHPVSSSSR